MKGIDVSHWQINMSGDVRAQCNALLASAADAGYKFVIAKATEGTSYVDPTLQQFAEAARQLNLIYANYHFAHHDLDPIQQADWYWWWVNASNARPAFYILDIEDTVNGTKADNVWVEKYMVAMLKHFGEKGYVYSYESYFSVAQWNSFRWNKWIAHINTDFQPIPNWDIWQYGKEQINGQNVDVNIWLP